MPNPSLEILRQHPKSVILMISEKRAADKVANYDFEWFDTDEGVLDFLPRVDQWARDDYADVGDMFHVYVIIEDTQSDPMTLGSIVAIGPDDWCEKMKEGITAGLIPLVPAIVPRKKRAPAKPKAAAKVAQGRKPSKAAAAAKGLPVEDAAEPAVPVQKAVAQKAAVKKAPAKVEAVRKAPKPKVDREAVKQRIIDRQAAKEAAAKANGEVPEAPSADQMANAFLAVGGGKGDRPLRKC